MSALPQNGQKLVDMRLNGRVPDLPVLVGLTGLLEFNNLTLQAEAGVAYDWRAVTALEIEVFASLDVPFSKLLRTLADIAAVVPKHMLLTFIEGAHVDCGEMRTVTDFALFDWLPMVVTPVRAAPARHIRAWNDGQAVARKLWQALGDKLPIPYEKAAELVVQVAGEKQRCG